ncbi:DUF892 family protein [Microvirga sp. P5_D2]
MNITSLRDLYIAELQEIRSVEEQLVEALPKMADVAGHTASPRGGDPAPAQYRAARARRPGHAGDAAGS